MPLLSIWNFFETMAWCLYGTLQTACIGSKYPGVQNFSSIANRQMLPVSMPITAVFPLLDHKKFSCSNSWKKVSSKMRHKTQKNFNFSHLEISFFVLNAVAEWNRCVFSQRSIFSDKLTLIDIRSCVISSHHEDRSVVFVANKDGIFGKIHFVSWPKYPNSLFG